MMHLVHSALRANITSLRKPACSLKGQNIEEQTNRYAAYQVTCSRYREEIKAIQKYWPGWMPKPPDSFKGAMSLS